MNLKVKNFRSVTKGNCLGFATVELPFGVLLHDIAIYDRSGTFHAMPQRMPLMGYDRRQQINNSGQPKFSDLVTFATAADEKAFTENLLASLREFRPEIFE